jgi:hypothetical protein
MTPTTKESSDPEFVTIGTFEPRITLPLVEELNRRKIIHRVKEVNHFSSSLTALAHSATGAGEVLVEIKKKYPRVRL